MKKIILGLVVASITATAAAAHPGRWVEGHWYQGNYYEGFYKPHHHPRPHPPKPKPVKPKPKPIELSPEQAFLVLLFGLTVLNNDK